MFLGQRVPEQLDRHDAHTVMPTSFVRGNFDMRYMKGYSATSWPVERSLVSKKTIQPLPTGADSPT